MIVICHSNRFESSTKPAEKPSTGRLVSSAQRGDVVQTAEAKHAPDGGVGSDMACSLGHRRVEYKAELKASQRAVGVPLDYQTSGVKVQQSRTAGHGSVMSEHMHGWSSWAGYSPRSCLLSSKLAWSIRCSEDCRKPTVKQPQALRKGLSPSTRHSRASGPRQCRANNVSVCKANGEMLLVSP